MLRKLSSELRNSFIEIPFLHIPVFFLRFCESAAKRILDDRCSYRQKNDR